MGSASASVSTSTGLVTASQLYAPYGGVRYTSGILPTDYGFTHQRADATSGLDDYGARWYDPVAGQFTSADTTLAGGLNRYAYVAGNPETLVDLSGESPVPAKPNWKWRLAKLILDIWAGIAAGEGILGPVVHVNTGPSGGRAPNGGDEVVEIEQPVSVQPVGAGGSPNSPGLSALPDGNGPAYILVGPNGQPLPTGNPIPSAPSSRQSVPRERPISDPFNPSPNDRNRPGRDGVQGDKFSVTPTINWSAVLSHHINVVTQRLAEYHGVHGPAWHDNPTADVPIWSHTGTHGLDPVSTPWSMVAMAGAAAIAIAATGIGGSGTRGTQGAYPSDWNLAR